MTAVVPSPSAPRVRPAPLLSMVRSELRWVFRRPRNLVGLGLLSLLPVVFGVGIALDDGPNSGGGGGDSSLISQVAGNGLVLPVAALSMAIFLLLPLAVSIVAADALAGESSHGTLRGLLLAPVGRLRLVVVKVAGVLALAVVAVLLIALVGVVTGLIVVGDAGGTTLSLSGTELSLPAVLARVALAAAWTVGQLCAIGAIALAVSSFTEHPLVVLAVSVGWLVISTVLTAIPALDWLWPMLLPTGWPAMADVLRDPVPLGELAQSTYRAGCYVLIGLGLTFARMLTRDA
ncbi:MAG TPA: ABC transporter permease subunit [Pseudonocardiaceae bacterium]